MKIKVLSVIVLAVLSVTAMKAQVSLGVEVGPNFQNMVGKDSDGDKVTNGLLVGFHVGVTAGIPIAPDFLFQTGLLFSQKGSKNNEGLIPFKAAGGDYNTTTRISYIELPLHLLFKPQFGSGHILLGFGPYVAYGLGGTQKVDYPNNPTIEQKIKFRSEIPIDDHWDIETVYFRGFDAGADIFAGYELDMGLFVLLKTQLGLLNMITDVRDWEGESNLKNTGFGLSVGYNF